MSKKQPAIVPCPGWSGAATSKYPNPAHHPCSEGHVNQAILRPHQKVCSRCSARKTRWDREHYSYEDARLRRAPSITVPAGHVWRVLSGVVTLERRDAMKLERSVERIREAVPTITPFEVIPAIEALIVPYEYDPDRDPVEQEAVAVTSGKYPHATTLDARWSWMVLRAVYGLEPQS